MGSNKTRQILQAYDLWGCKQSKKNQDPDTRSRHLNQPTVALVRKREKSATFHVFFVKSWPRHAPMSRGFASNLMYSTKKESIVSLVFSVISFFFLFLTQGKKVDMLCHHLPICFIQRASRFLTIHNGVKSILK